ncbi:hypothetical protein [Stenotrophomonas sp. NPDC077659]|uniref:hypothetical protein n=1 Tax=Stenotrophomonas sp. NPDC077659 TaxID=3390694 RepID=UPI003D00CFF7
MPRMIVAVAAERPALLAVAATALLIPARLLELASELLSTLRAWLLRLVIFTMKRWPGAALLAAVAGSSRVMTLLVLSFGAACAPVLASRRMEAMAAARDVLTDMERLLMIWKGKAAQGQARA